MNGYITLYKCEKGGSPGWLRSRLRDAGPRWTPRGLEDETPATLICPLPFSKLYRKPDAPRKSAPPRGDQVPAASGAGSAAGERSRSRPPLAIPLPEAEQAAQHDRRQARRFLKDVDRAAHRQRPGPVAIEERAVVPVQLGGDVQQGGVESRAAWAVCKGGLEQPRDRFAA